MPNPRLSMYHTARRTLILAAAALAFGVGKADATLTLSDADLAALVTGKATARSLFQFGKLRIDGDVAVAHRLGFLKALIDP